MKFNRVDLITRIDEAIERVIKETEVTNQELRKGYNKAREEWMLKVMPDWEQLARTILKNSKSGKPIKVLLNPCAIIRAVHQFKHDDT